MFFVVIYRSPSQSSDEFDLFLSRLELVIEHMRHEKPDFIILTGDFNSKTKQWWPDGEETKEERGPIKSVNREFVHDSIN